MAQEAPGQTLQATALVHEAYVRLAVTTPTSPNCAKYPWHEMVQAEPSRIELNLRHQLAVLVPSQASLHSELNLKLRAEKRSVVTDQDFAGGVVEGACFDV